MNKPVIIGSSVAVVFLIWYLLMDMGALPSLWQNTESISGIGTIVSTENTVQQKETGSLFWQEAKSKNQLQYYDSILTLENSKSKISLNDGTQIEIDPNTLIVLEPPDKTGGPAQLIVLRGNAKVIGSSKSVAIVNKPEPVRFLAQVMTSIENEEEEEAMPEPQKEQTAQEPMPVRIKKPTVIVIDEPIVESKPEQITAMQIKPIKQQKTKILSWWVWVGVGMNYVDYSQTVANLSDVNYQVIKGPSYFTRIGKFFLNTWGFDFSYKDSPGSVVSTATIPVSNGNYHWQTFTAEALKIISQNKIKIMDLNSFVDLRAGVQQHYVPFIAAQSSGGVQVRKNTLTMASLGFDWILGKNKRLYYEIQGRYQYPVSSGASDSNTFSIKPTFAFDGSVGMAYKISDAFSLGAYWYGQWHNYNFTYFDSGENVTNSGSQNLFYSNTDLRLGISF